MAVSSRLAKHRADMAVRRIERARRAEREANFDFMVWTTVRDFANGRDDPTKPYTGGTDEYNRAHAKARLIWEGKV